MPSDRDAAGAGRFAVGLPALPADLDPRGRHRSRSRRGGGGRRPVLALTRVVSALLSAVLLLTFGMYWWKYHSFNAGLQRLNVFGASVSKPSHDIDGKDQNILIVGNDDRSTMTAAEVHLLHTGVDGGSLNTDTMMIVHVPADGKRATLLSLPRDSYVAIPGFSSNKLNAAYPDGYSAASGSASSKRAAGARVLVQTIQNLTGLTIDHFVQVDLLGFYRISNAIGGVSVNMCNAVSDKNSGLNLHKGVNVVKGVSALAFVRQRYNFPDGNGDLDRVQRQRYFLTAAFRKLASAGTILNPVALQNLLNAVRSSMYMDTGLDPIALGRQMENLSANNIVGRTIPTEGFGYANVGGQSLSIVKVDPAHVKAFVNTLIGTTDSALASAKTVAPSTVTVDVLNAGSGINNAARDNSNNLRTQGFQIGTVSDHASISATTIEYADGMQAQAKTLAAYVPGAVLLKAAVAHVTLLLGADGIGAKAKVAGSSSSAAPTTSAAPQPKAIDSGCIN
jgi:LCP family protein required for cell wall assembly